MKWEKKKKLTYVPRDVNNVSWALFSFYHLPVIPLALVSLFPIPSLSLQPSCPCSPFPHCHFSPHIPVPHSLIILSPLMSLFPVPLSSYYPPYEQQLTAMAWVGAEVPSGCCLIKTELEPKKTKENISYLRKEKRTWEISYLGPKQHLLSFGPNVVHLWLFAVLSEVGVGMAVAVVVVDRVEKVVVVR